MTVIADFETAMGLVKTEIDARNYVTAREKLASAWSVYLMIPTEGEHESVRFQYRDDLTTLDSLLEKLESTTARSTDTKRFAKTRFGFG